MNTNNHTAVDGTEPSAATADAERAIARRQDTVQRRAVDRDSFAFDEVQDPIRCRLGEDCLVDREHGPDECYGRDWAWRLYRDNGGEG